MWLKRVWFGLVYKSECECQQLEFGYAAYLTGVNRAQSHRELELELERESRS